MDWSRADYYRDKEFIGVLKLATRGGYFYYLNELSPWMAPHPPSSPKVATYLVLRRGHLIIRPKGFWGSALHHISYYTPTQFIPGSPSDARIFMTEVRGRILGRPPQWGCHYSDLRPSDQFRGLPQPYREPDPSINQPIDQPAHSTSGFRDPVGLKLINEMIGLLLLRGDARVLRTDAEGESQRKVVSHHLLARSQGPIAQTTRSGRGVTPYRLIIEGDMGPKVATRVFSGRGLHFTHQAFGELHPDFSGSPTIILRDTSTWITVYLLSPSPP
ncbi:hypothetical protein QVD99_003366 [Batrachochytrium dendrobatidis]|nr:hypothetical protein QVD99_003366 [Batrachochytrium dendrobatidis]